MKNCSLCGKFQPINNFGTKRNNKPNSWCKSCVAERTKEYKKTYNGLVQQMYQLQIKSSKRREHNLPNYTREDLYTWVTDQPNFSTLFSTWSNANYPKNLIPSVDRLDDNLPYTLENIQLMTWEENNDKGKDCYLNGKLGRKVNQLDLEGNLIKQWPNISMPAKEVNCSLGEISRVCMGRRNTCRNFKWEYTDNDVK